VVPLSLLLFGAFGTTVTVSVSLLLPLAAGRPPCVAADFPRVPYCRTVSVSPPTVALPSRLFLAVFGDAVSVSVPLPLPLAAERLIQLAFAAAVQAHVAPDAVSVTTALVPAADAVMLDCDSANVHRAGVAPFWVRVTTVPATVRLAVRCAVAVFEETLTLTVPEPMPVASDGVAQVAFDEAVQAQDAALAVTVIAKVSPAALDACDEGVTVKVQGTACAPTDTAAPMALATE